MKKIIKYVIFILLIIFFALLVYLMKSGNIITFDDMVYAFLTDNITDEKTRIFSFITNFASYQVIILLCIASLIFNKNIKTGIIISVNSLNSVLINKLAKTLIARPRPIVLALVNETGYSFPSGHAMAAMSFYGFLIYLIYKSNLNKYTKLIYSFLLIIIILLIGISRIYLGVHYASDILAGYTLSIIYMFIYIFAVDKIKNKHKSV